MNTIKALKRLKGSIKFQAVGASEIAQLVQKCMPLPKLNQDELNNLVRNDRIPAIFQSIFKCLTFLIHENFPSQTVSTHKTNKSSSIFISY